VVGEERRLPAGARRRGFLQVEGESPVKSPSVGSQDAGIGGLLGERALEEVFAFGQACPLANQLSAEEMGEGAVQIRPSAVQRLERAIAEEAPDDRRKLEQRLGRFRQPVDPRGDHPSERRRDGEVADVLGGRPAVSLTADRPLLD
jgi:hypothetical protein